MHYYVFMAIVFAIVAAIIAYSKGRNGLGWFTTGLLIGPFAFIVAALPPVPRKGLYDECPRCGEVIRENATMCRHCGAEFR